MGKDQRSKQHGLDVRRNRKIKEQRRFHVTGPPPDRRKPKKP